MEVTALTFDSTDFSGLVGSGSNNECRTVAELDACERLRDGGRAGRRLVVVNQHTGTIEGYRLAVLDRGCTSRRVAGDLEVTDADRAINRISPRDCHLLDGIGGETIEGLEFIVRNLILVGDKTRDRDIADVNEAISVISDQTRQGRKYVLVGECHFPEIEIEGRSIFQRDRTGGNRRNSRTGRGCLRSNLTILDFKTENIERRNGQVAVGNLDRAVSGRGIQSRGNGEITFN